MYLVVTKTILMCPYTIRVHLTPANIAVLLLFACACLHSCARFFYFYYRLVFGILYPAYSSFKAIKNKDVKEYSRWMCYWVVFGIFSFFEVFSDIIIGLWMPFYYEIKILFVLWLVSPYGNGARIMYKNIVHPQLNKWEQVIDFYISTAKEFGVTSVWSLWKKIAAYFNNIMLYLVHMTQLALFQQLQNSGYNSAGPGQSQMQFPRYLFPISEQSPITIEQLQTSNKHINHINVDARRGLDENDRMLIDEMSTSTPINAHRWLSEGALNVLESEETDAVPATPSNTSPTARFESEMNLDDWEKMDAEELSPTKIIKRKKQKKVNSRECLNSSPKRKGLFRAAAQRAREKFKNEFDQ